MVIAKFFPIVFTLLFVAVIVGLFMHYKLLTILKERHFEKWKELGNPSLFANNSVRNNFAVLAFLKNKDYIQMNDPQLTRIAHIVWNYTIGYIIFFTIVLILFAIQLIK